MIFRLAITLSTAALLASCGGGGGGGGGSSGGNGTPATGFAALPPASTLAQSCAAPRSGADPYTGRAYTDRQGSLLTEQNWLAAWTNDLYLWYSEVPYPNPASYTDTLTYFAALKTPLLSPSGAPKDKQGEHFTYSTSAWEALVNSGAQLGYGATWSLLSATVPRSAVVAYTDPNTPATSTSVALARGAKILQVDGVDLVNDNTQAGVNVLNAGLYPTTAGTSHTFVVQDLGSNTTRTITMTPTNVTSAPVQNVSTMATGTGTVGYMLFNDHIVTAESALINAVTQLKTAGVSDLVIDLRYNGGGLLDIANELAYMVAGPTKTAGKTFELLTFNDKHPTTDPVTGATITPVLFQSTALGYSATAGTALPYLGLSKVYVLTGPGTASASESVMNSLRGVGVQVIQIGSTTYGKPYGFYPQDNCGTTYFSIEFKGVNAAGFGDYSDGFTPANSTAAAALPAGALSVLPGCSVGDDFNHALGDPNELRLAAALQYRSGGTCPAATGLGSPRLLKASTTPSDGVVYKTPFLSNRIILH
jgi:hypothetical protein